MGSCRLRLLVTSLRNLKYLSEQLLVEQDSAVSRYISCFLRFTSQAILDSSCEIVRSVGSASFMSSFSELISIPYSVRTLVKFGILLLEAGRGRTEVAEGMFGF